jgi:hypothetical protein
MKKQFFFLFVLLSIFAVSCRKKISVPDDSLTKIFGKWNWVQSYEPTGGFSTPASSGNVIYRLYSSKGVFEQYQNKKRNERLNFHFSTSNGSFSNSVFTIVYQHRALHWSEAHSTEYIKFKGIDTLYLSYTCDTCGYDLYVKDK